MVRAPLLAFFSGALALLVVTFFARPAHADEVCAGCRFHFVAPAGHGGTPAPLIVTLHGDYQPVAKMHEAWERAAAPHNISVLSLSCPWDKGCRGSWWRWNGDPSWVTNVIADVVAKFQVDTSHIYLVGWSGGGTYIGWHTRELAHDAAAIVIFGGGAAPAAAQCSDPRTPVYFLVGDRNPLHRLAKDLRDHYVACNHPVTWDLVSGADHDGEWASLRTHQKAVLDFLLAHPRPQAATVVP
jgi:poly(3-hydroxybutyrate) depolymerase